MRIVGQAPPALVLTDLQIGDAADDGAQLLRVLEMSFPDVLRVVFSSAGLFQLNAVVRAGHAHAAFDKSSDVHDLVGVIHALISRSLSSGAAVPK